MTSLSYQNKAYVPYGEILLWICQADKIFMETIICSLYFKEYAHTFCFFWKISSFYWLDFWCQSADNEYLGWWIKKSS